MFVIFNFLVPQNFVNIRFETKQYLTQKKKKKKKWYLKLTFGIIYFLMCVIAAQEDHIRSKIKHIICIYLIIFQKILQYFHNKL